MQKIRLFIAAFCCLMMAFTACNNKPEVKELSLDPLLEWGCSLADVEAYMQKRTWYQDGNDKPEYWADPFDCWQKWYWVDMTNGITEQYLFETEDGRNLRYVLCCCFNPTVPTETFKNTLKRQGFHATGNTILFDDINYYDQYLSADGKTEALTLADNEGWYVTYRPYNKQ